MTVPTHTCPTCATPLPEAAAFCPHCGAATPTQDSDGQGSTAHEARLRAALAERYRVQQEIGRGGHAVVYLAHDLRHDRPVALKVLVSELALSVRASRFLREIRIAAKLNHPHILPLLDSGEAAGSLYYVMPYVEGESLRDRLQRENQLTIPAALEIAHEVADALHYAHSRDVVHRDIKPENILLQAGHAVVTDFGIARALTTASGQTVTEAGVAIGTPAYMSPEQGSGDKRVDRRSDIYSLGCVLYEVLAGHPPFTGTSAQEILARHSLDPVPSLRAARPAVPEAVEEAVGKALAKSPADRFPSAAEFAQALSASAPRQHLVTAPVDVRRRRPRRAFLLLVGLSTAAGAGLVLRILFSRSQLEPPLSPLNAFPSETSVTVPPWENLTDELRKPHSYRYCFWQIEPDGSRFGLGQGSSISSDLDARVWIAEPVVYRFDADFAIHPREDSTLMVANVIVARARSHGEQSPGDLGGRRVQLDEEAYRRWVVVRPGAGALFPFGAPRRNERALAVEIRREERATPGRCQFDSTVVPMLVPPFALKAQGLRRLRGAWLRLEIGSDSQWHSVFQGQVLTRVPVRIDLGPRGARGQALAFELQTSESAARSICWHWFWIDMQPPEGGACALVHRGTAVQRLYGSKAGFLRVTVLSVN